MVRELTLLKVDLDGALFGSKSHSHDDDGSVTVPEQASDAEEASSGGSKLRALLALAALAVLAVGVRKLRNHRGGKEYDIDLDEKPAEADAVAPEQ